MYIYIYIHIYIYIYIITCSGSCSSVQPILLGSLRTRDPMVWPSVPRLARLRVALAQATASWPDVILSSSPRGVPSLSDPCPGCHGPPCQSGEFPASGFLPRVSRGFAGLRLSWKSLRRRWPCRRWRVSVSFCWLAGSRGLSISVMSWSFVHFPLSQSSRERIWRS